MSTNRLEKKMSAITTNGKKALVAYIVGGDPTLEATVPVMHALVEAGVDVIELGMPFSDPEAEGPTIQLAHERALAQGSSLTACIDMTARFRETNQDNPVVLMGYLNPIETMGYETFASRASAAGVDGTIIVNLPPEESGEFGELLKEHDLCSVYLLAPTTTETRARAVTSVSRGFVYYVSLKGTTGAGSINTSEVASRIGGFRKLTDLPLVVGFGIKDGPTAREVARLSDGVAVGTALVRLMEQHADDQHALIASLTVLVTEIRQHLDAEVTE